MLTFPQPLPIRLRLTRRGAKRSKTGWVIRGPIRDPATPVSYFATAEVGRPSSQPLDFYNIISRQCIETFNTKTLREGMEPILKLMRVMQKDPVINKKVIEMLRMESYQRRFILNSWLEQLRIRHASENLLSALSCLFDDKTAADVLTLINKTKLNYSE